MGWCDIVVERSMIQISSSQHENCYPKEGMIKQLDHALFIVITFSNERSNNVTRERYHQTGVWSREQKKGTKESECKHHL